MMHDSIQPAKTPIQAPAIGNLVAAGVVGVAVMLALNAAAFAFLKPMTIGADTLGPGEAAYDSFYDGCVALLTLAVPSFLGGLVLSRIARATALKVSMAAFTLAAVVGVVHQFWQVPIVSPHATHSPFMFYMLRNPIVILAFGTLGGWLGGEFASGRFTLEDKEPVHPDPDDD